MDQEEVLMPRVPTKDNLSTTPSVESNFRFRNTQTLEEASLAGRRLEEQGAQLEQAGGRAVGAQLEVLEQANQLRVDDAINQAREEAIRLQYDPQEGYENLKGYDALERPEGIPLTDEYGGKLQERLSNISNTLGNDQQRAIFSEQSRDLIAGFREGTMTYEGKEFQEYSKSVRRGTIANRTQEIALNYRNPRVIQDAILSIEASAADLARQEGLAATEQTSEARKAISKGHMVVIETAIQKEDSVYADDYFKKNARTMEPDDILRINTVLGEQLDTRIATETVDKTLREEQRNFITPDVDRAFNIALGTESGEQQFGGPGSVAGPDEPTESPAGAIGIAQVMPGTGPEAAQLAGLEWDENRWRNDAEYNRAIGQAYFEKQLRDFDGSLAKAYAAYNAGPGATRKAIKKAGVGGNWLELLPAETQNYVDKNVTAFNGGRGKAKRPTITEFKDKVREQVGTDSPRRLKLALAEAETRYDDMIEGIEQEEDRAVADAMQAVLDNGGDYSSLDTLMRSSIPPDQVGKVIDFAKKIAKGDDTTNLVLYNQFTENPEMLASLTDDKFLKLRAEFNEADFKHFTKIRADILNGDQPEAQNPGNLNTSAINASVNNRFLELGITTKDDPEQVGAIRKFVNQAIILSQTSSGKKMNDAEVEQFIDKLFSERGTYDKMFGNEEGPVLNTSFSDIPTPTRKEIQASFKKQGIDPTDQEVLEAYWRSVFFNQNKTNEKGSF